jgi:hypothetical protein
VLVAKTVRELLSIHNIGQRLFAKHVLGLSQGTVSELLNGEGNGGIWTVSLVEILDWLSMTGLGEVFSSDSTSIMSLLLTGDVGAGCVTLIGNGSFFYLALLEDKNSFMCICTFLAGDSSTPALSENTEAFATMLGEEIAATYHSEQQQAEKSPEVRPSSSEAPTSPVSSKNNFYNRIIGISCFLYTKLVCDTFHFKSVYYFY